MQQVWIWTATKLKIGNPIMRKVETNYLKMIHKISLK